MVTSAANASARRSTPRRHRVHRSPLRLPSDVQHFDSAHARALGGALVQHRFLYKSVTSTTATAPWRSLRRNLGSTETAIPPHAPPVTPKATPAALSTRPTATICSASPDRRRSRTKSRAAHTQTTPGSTAPRIRSSGRTGTRECTRCPSSSRARRSAQATGCSTRGRGLKRTYPGSSSPLAIRSARVRGAR